MSTCLVLEGGALRGLYTSGALAYLYEKGLDVQCIIGVSAGALFGVNYFSNQPQRALQYNLKYCKSKRYMSLRSLIFTGNVVNKRFAYYKVTKKLFPFDEETFEKNNKKFYAVATNVVTGKAEYLKIDKPIEQLEELRATSAMPLLSRIIKIKKEKYLDGAIADSIPVKKAIEMGYDKIVVILTQPMGYKKDEVTVKEFKKLSKRYKQYPEFVKACITRPKRYNKCLDNINKLAKENKIFVIRPTEKININPIKKTNKELQDAYDLGYNNMKDLYDNLVKFLK